MNDSKSKIHSFDSSTIPCPIGIVGMGINGLTTKKLLLAVGYSEKDIITFDKKPELGQFSEINLYLEKKPKTHIISPGVPLSEPWIDQARARGELITSELGIASRFLTSEKIIGITGSVGKSTTTALLGAAASSVFQNTFVGGNLGTPLAQYIYELKLKKRHRAKWLILELSSYQIENLEPLKLNHSVITYLGPNHLERYSGFIEYYKTKWSLIEITKGNIYLNQNGGELYTFANEHLPSSRARQSHLKWVNRKDPLFDHLNWERVALLGDHNRDNIALALRIASDLEWGNPAQEAILHFKGLPHRLENLGDINGIHYINDSKATAIDSVLASVTSLHSCVPEDHRLILLLGGRDKNLPWENLSKLLDQKKLRFFFFGECARLAQGKSHLPGKSFSTLKEALNYVREYAKTGDWVLLSPGGSSLDEFKNFEARGDFFKSFFVTNHNLA